jgi:two-component system response regulator GlrR
MAQPHSVLVVDDDPALRRTLELRLREEGYAVRVADSGERALALLAAAPADLVIADARMDRMDGLAPFSELQRSHPRLPVMILTAHGSIPDAGDTTRRGAFAYLTRPIDAAQLLGEVRRAIRLAAPAATPAASWRAQIVTRNPRLMATLDEAQAVAATDASVLICGETGTGKELLAQAIHDASARGARPFVAVNCGPIPEHLMESELFGHLRGAFTGALRDQRGLVASADGGTLFLDEIGDMPAPLQVKLLRVLQEREVRPVGATRPLPVDIRVISATHRGLEAEMRAGRFREDLFFRLNVVRLRLPAPRERVEDVPILAAHFPAGLAHKYRKPPRGFAAEALERLSIAPPTRSSPSTTRGAGFRYPRRPCPRPARHAPTHPSPRSPACCSTRWSGACRGGRSGS